MIISIDSDTLIVEDIYTMSQTDTYTFRNLSRRGIISDLRISYEETNMIENAFATIWTPTITYKSHRIA